MKSRNAIVCVLGALLSIQCMPQQSSSDTKDLAEVSSHATPAQQRIAAAGQQLQANSRKIQAYNDLALAFLERARETADPAYLNNADAALVKGLSLDASNFQLQRTQVALMLRKNEYAQAKERATQLNHHTPDDVMTYGYLAEADIALGLYDDAERNAQWMLNLRPNNIPGLLIGAQLRTLFGDVQGAIDFLNLASSETSPTEVEDLAWIDNQIASIQIDSGKYEAAAQILDQAEKLFPHYPCTIENLARVYMGQNQASDAVELWKQAAAIDRNPHILHELAEAQRAAGEEKEAAATFADFQKRAAAAETATDASKLDLILMLSASESTAQDALKYADRRAAARQDIWTLDAYAWALYANGKYQEAETTIQKAIAVGIQSSQIFDHAGHIAQELNHSADSAKYFTLAFQSNPSSKYGLEARKSLSSTAPAVGAKLLPATTSAVSSNGDAHGHADSSERSNIARGIDLDRTFPAFAPIPQTLLVARPTGTEQAIRSAQSAVTHNTSDATAYTSLGAAHFQHARETGDVGDYQLAEESLSKSLDLTSTDFSADEAFRTMAEVCMGEHRFTDAVTYAQKALSLGSGDVSPFAIVGDAYADMGEYDRAHAAYDRLTPRDMVLEPRAAYARDSRLSYLKFVEGDTSGAINLMKTAVKEGIEAQLPSENLAWLYFELGEYFSQAGDVASADSSYVAALTSHPGDYRALAALAKLRANNGRYEDAITLYQRAIAVVPMPTFIAELGDLYAKLGNHVEAKKQYAQVEYIGLLGHINQVLHNRDLAVFYADHDIKLPEALALAQKELEVRHDVYTWDALAWALYKNGKITEAASESEKALRLGTQDSLLLFHAGMIAEAMNLHDRARLDFKQALKTNPHFHLTYASVAQRHLTMLEAQSNSRDGVTDHAF